MDSSIGNSTFGFYDPGIAYSEYSGYGGYSGSSGLFGPSLHYYPYTNQSYATNLVAEWQAGTFKLASCLEFNCSMACIDPEFWFGSFITCSLYPTFSLAIDAGNFTDEQVGYLSKEGIYGGSYDGYQNLDLVARISTVVVSCMAEYCQFSPGCSDSPGYSSCASSDPSLASYSSLDATTVYDCMANAICFYKPQVNSDIAGIGVSIPKHQLVPPFANILPICRCFFLMPYKAVPQSLLSSPCSFGKQGPLCDLAVQHLITSINDISMP
jgi:hypothetical protein